MKPLRDMLRDYFDNVQNCAAIYEGSEEHSIAIDGEIDLDALAKYIDAWFVAEIKAVAARM